MKFAIRCITSLSLVLAADAASAQVAVPELPVKAFTTVGPGRSPVLGVKSGTWTSVHYVAPDPSWGMDTPRFWDTLSRVGDAQSWYPDAAWEFWLENDDYDPVNCAWGGTRIFCSFWAVMGERRLDDQIVMFDYATDRYSQRVFSANVPRLDIADARLLPPRRIGGVNGDRAVVETLGHTFSFSGDRRYSAVDLVVDIGTSQLWSTTVIEESPLNTIQEVSHPLINESGMVAYQTLDASGDYALNLTDAMTGVTHTNSGFGYPLNPSDISGNGVAVETSTSVTFEGFDQVPGDAWFTGPSPDPSTFGCQSFRGLKADHRPAPTFWLVQGINCNGEASVLYALYNTTAPGSIWEAYRVGTLSDNPEYDVYRDEIVYVDASGDVQWLRHALGPLEFEVFNEVEPNDTTSAAYPLPLNENSGSLILGRGAFSDSSDVDYWRVDAKAGLVFTLTPDDWAACSDGISGVAYTIEVTDHAGVPLPPYQTTGGWQCPTNWYEAPGTGRYFISIVREGTLHNEYDLHVSVP